MFLDEEIAKKKVSTWGRLVTIFIPPGWWIGNKKLFKVGLNGEETKVK